jgi:sigma-54 dependent transcriptional regulator, acetoin dehydrogenase operon transcriptional activator AcoR
VLIIGGTVAQRDRVARTFHSESPLRAGPFVLVDCGTDRDRLRVALRAWSAPGSSGPTNPLREAEEGTLYLERVEDVPPDTQPLLLALALRLQGELVGGTGWPCAGRLVAGNPHPLTVAVSEGRFDPALHDALDKVRVDLGPDVATVGSG